MTGSMTTVPVLWGARVSAVLLPTVTLYNSGLATVWFLVLAGGFGAAQVFRHGAAAVPRGPLPGLLAGLAGLAVASAVWSVVPDKSLRSGLNFLLVLTPVLLLFAPPGRPALERGMLPRYTAVGLCLAVAVVVVEAVSGNALLALVQAPYAEGGEWFPSLHEVSLFNRGLTLLALLLWPAAGWIWVRESRPGAALALLAAGAAVCWVGNSAAVKSAVVVGGLCLTAAVAAPRLAAFAAVVAAVAYGAVIPFTVGTLFDLSDRLPAGFAETANLRLEIWDHLDRLAWQRPWLGWGASATNALPAMPAEAGYATRLAGLQAAHPHSVPLEVRLELGVPGLAVLALAVVALVRAALTVDARLRPFALATLAGGLWIGGLSFRAWSDATVFLFAAPVLLLMLAGPRQAPVHTRRSGMAPLRQGEGENPDR